VFSLRDRILVLQRLPDGSTEDWWFDGSRWSLVQQAQPLPDEQGTVYVTHAGQLLRLTRERRWEWTGAGWGSARALSGAPTGAVPLAALGRSTRGPLVEFSAGGMTTAWTLDGDTWVPASFRFLPGVTTFAVGDELWSSGRCTDAPSGRLLCHWRDGAWTRVVTDGPTPPEAAFALVPAGRDVYLVGMASTFPPQPTRTLCRLRFP
jgi:hypothetical protein